LQRSRGSDGRSSGNPARIARCRATAGQISCLHSTTMKRSVPGCWLESRSAQVYGQKTSEPPASPSNNPITRRSLWSRALLSQGARPSRPRVIVYVRRTGSTVHVAAVCDLEYRNGAVLIDDLVHHTVVPLTHTIEILSAKLLGARWSRFLGELPHACHRSSTVLQRNSLEFFGGRRLDQQPIACHGVACLSERSQGRGSVPSRAHGTRRGPQHPRLGSDGPRHSRDPKCSCRSRRPSLEGRGEAPSPDIRWLAAKSPCVRCSAKSPKRQDVNNGRPPNYAVNATALALQRTSAGLNKTEQRCANTILCGLRRQQSG
jgi:hypothetical protein